ncbi:hypothetical protein TNCV_2359741 [Trichonephila clavipes]|nr:hypothetical protein TNCV_2359741 [Trichonephila clavipes]
MPIYGVPAPVRSVPERRDGQYYQLVLSGKVTGFSKVRFQILVPHPGKHRERTLHTPRILRRNRGLLLASLSLPVQSLERGIMVVRHYPAINKSRSNEEWVRSIALILTTNGVVILEMSITDYEQTLSYV